MSTSHLFTSIVRADYMARPVPNPLDALHAVNAQILMNKMLMQFIFWVFYEIR